MAVAANEVEVLDGGIQANAPSKGSFALNMLYDNNCWQVREGFGQVTQFDTEMSAPTSGMATGSWGYTHHMGSALIKTSFGNLQMLSVFLADVNTSYAGGPTNAYTYSVATPLYMVSIYDLTTNERFEVPLYPHTSQTAVSSTYGDEPPSTIGSRTKVEIGHGIEGMMPQYQTSYTNNYAAWIKAKDEFFFFEEFNDILYFGNTVAGTWAYLPASFNGLRKTGLDRVSQHEFAEAYGESSMITPVVLSPGLNPEAFVYLRTSDMPNPVDVAVLQNRFVYATGRTVFFSDPGFPANIVADNSMAIPSEEEITAITELNSNLVIYTENETWLYQPSVGEIASAGRLTRTSQTVGCVGPNALCSVEGALVWVDSSGVYTTSNGLETQLMSTDITPFFSREGMTNPMTSYFVDSGHTTLAGEQPLTTMRLDPKGAKCCYIAERRLLVVSVPGLSGALVLSNGKWAWWTFESMVADDGAGNAIVGVSQRLPAPWVLNYQDDLFAIAGPDIQAITDDARRVGGSAIDFDITSRSFFIMEYGRGGNIDRSITDEDDRKLTGYGSVIGPRGAAEVLPPATSADCVSYDGGFFFEDPIKVPTGYVFPSGIETASPETYLIPVVVVPPRGVFLAGAVGGIDAINARLSFDNGRWQPVFNHGSNSTLELILPTERMESAVPAAGTDPWTVLTYSDAAMTTPSRDGGYLLINWTGSHAGHYHTPNMNLNPGRRNRLMFLPFKRIGARLADDCSGMGWEVLVNTTPTPNTSYLTLSDTGTAVRRMSLNVFNRWSMGTGTVRKEDSVSQPVDWAYKSTNVGLGEGKELKMRGIYADLLSHGASTDKLNTVWPYGLFNTIIGSDRKEWIAQVIDMTPAQPAVDQQDRVAPFTSKNTLRTRVQRSDGELVDKVFQSGGTDIVWGNPGVAAGSDPGNLLIGDEDTSTLSVSMSVKGQSFSVMNFGFIMNRAERLLIEGVKAVFRVVGGRRRRGR